MIQIRASVNPLDYLELRYRNPIAIEALRELPGKRYSLDNNGYPRGREIDIAPIDPYIGRLYYLNQALYRALMPDIRDALSSEVRNFLTLNRDPRLPEKIDQDNPDSNNPSTPHSQENPFNISSLGIEMDMSKASIESRDKLGQKRRDLNQFYVTREFLLPLAMFGIHSADPAYTATILSAHRFGIKHPNPEVRLATVLILGESIKSIWFNFQMHTRALPCHQNNTLSTITSKNLRDDLASLRTISNALTQEGYGINDNNFDVQNIATNTVQNVHKAQTIISKYIDKVPNN